MKPNISSGNISNGISVQKQNPYSPTETQDVGPERHRIRWPRRLIAAYWMVLVAYCVPLFFMADSSSAGIWQRLAYGSVIALPILGLGAGFSIAVLRDRKLPKSIHGFAVLHLLLTSVAVIFGFCPLIAVI